jgi:4-oxalocrotonate tautomerase
MPLLTVTLSAAPAPALSERVAAFLTDTTARVLGKDPTITAVVVHYVDPAHWVVSGGPLAGQHQHSFALEVKVTDSTNTKAEKAEYAHRVFAGMAGLLGGELHHESYVHVHECRADAYGYGGETNERRYVVGQMAPTRPAPSRPAGAAAGAGA